MKNTKKVYFLGILALLSLVLIAIPTNATIAQTEINYTMVWDVVGLGERMWISEEGVWQLRDVPHFGHVVASEVDFTGNLYLLSSLILFDDLLNPTTYNSIGSGLFEFNGIYNGEPASFTGKINFEINYFHLTGKFNLFGSGSLEGHLKGTVEGWLGGIYSVQMSLWN